MDGVDDDALGLDLAALNAENEDIMYVGPSPLKASAHGDLLHAPCIETLFCERGPVHAPPAPAPSTATDFEGCVAPSSGAMLGACEEVPELATPLLACFGYVEEQQMPKSVQVSVAVADDGGDAHDAP